eukprot:m.105660 g.105660  ORF g.105660 m.105660 type:complete len:425 (+) comp13886_c0_seq3:67-1341(+)
MRPKQSGSSLDQCASCKQFAEERLEKLKRDGRIRVGYHPYRVRLCSLCGINIKDVKISDWNPSMEKLAREGQVIKYTEEARKVLKQERPNACTGFSLCDSVKRTIGPGNFITLCSDDKCNTCVNTIWNYKVCKCGKVVPKAAKCCTAGRPKVKAVKMKERTQVNYDNAVAKMKAAAADIASITGRCTQFQIGSFREGDKDDDNKSLIEAYLIPPQNQVAVGAMMLKNSKIVVTPAIKDPEIMITYFNRVAEATTTPNAAWGTRKSDFALATDALAFCHAITSNERVNKCSPLLESRYHPEWKTPKIFTMVLEESEDRATALYNWSRAEEVRVLPVAAKDPSKAKTAWKAKNEFDGSWESAPWVDCADFPLELSARKMSKRAKKTKNYIPPPPPEVGLEASANARKRVMSNTDTADADARRKRTR